VAKVVQNVLPGQQVSYLPHVRDFRSAVAFSKASFRLDLMGRSESDGSGDLSAIGQNLLDSAARPGSLWQSVVLPAQRRAIKGPADFLKNVGSVDPGSSW
jgi:hypothetical protein